MLNSIKSVRMCVNKQEEISMWACRRRKTITRAIQLMQMMHADVCGFLVPPLLYSMSCALGMREDREVFSNLGIPLLPGDEEGTLPLPACGAAKQECGSKTAPKARLLPRGNFISPSANSSVSADSWQSRAAQSMLWKSNQIIERKPQVFGAVCSGPVCLISFGIGLTGRLT